MADVIGNRYIVVKLIGEGGMADVYLAVDSILKREVAVKVLRGDLNEDPVNLQRFQREASAITNLSHPNIVEVYDVGEDNHRSYFVMEYVPGKTLKQLTKQRGAVNPTEAVNIMKQLVSATAHAHHNGIIHRDIKSQNVLIKDDGTVKLSDFGIAATGDSQQLTQTDTVMGSVHYLAPELARGESATVQSDIYSLGIVFYEMLTGDVPFRGDTAVQIALKHMHDEIPSVRAFNPDLPQAVENIIIKATAKDKGLRYASADDMYDDLITCLDFSRSHEAKLVLPNPKRNAIGQEVHSEPIKVKKKASSVVETSTILSAMAAVALGLAILYIIMVLAGHTPNNSKKVKIPDILNQNYQDAITILHNNDLQVQTVNREPTDDYDEGVVFRVSPVVGTEVEKDTYVILYVSSGRRVTIGNYVGQKLDDVKYTLERQGFTVFVDYIQDAAAPGTILTQSVEEGTVFQPDELKQIKFEVSSEITYVVENSLMGMEIEQAKAYLEDKGIKVKTVRRSAESNPIDENGEFVYKTGVVVEIDPVPGSLYSQTEGAFITLYYY